MNKNKKVFIAMSPHKSRWDLAGQAGGVKNHHKKLVVVAMYTNEGLKFQMVLGPLKFEPRQRGRPRVMV